MTTPDTIYHNRKSNRLVNEKSPYLLQSYILVVIGAMFIKDTTY